MIVLIALIGLADSYIVMLSRLVLPGHPAGSTSLSLSGTTILIGAMIRNGKFFFVAFGCLPLEVDLR